MIDDIYLEETTRTLRLSIRDDHGVIEINTDDKETLVITGNSSGLKLFAFALLTVVKTESATALEYDNGVLIDHSEINEIIVKPKEYEPSPPIVLSWRDKLISWGFGLFLLYCVFIAVGSVLGLIYTVSVWIIHIIQQQFI